MKPNKIVVFIIRMLFILLFLYSGIAKLVNYTSFSIQLKEIYFIRPYSLWLTWFIPTIELLIACMLLIKPLLLKGLYACFFLTTLFTIYIIILSNIDNEIPCSCGGLLEKIPHAFHIIINLSLTTISLIGIYIETHFTNKAMQKLTNVI